MDNDDGSIDSVKAKSVFDVKFSLVRADSVIAVSLLSDSLKTKIDIFVIFVSSVLSISVDS